jgi:hypothetical protein
MPGFRPSFFSPSLSSVPVCLLQYRVCNVRFFTSVCHSWDSAPHLLSRARHAHQRVHYTVWRQPYRRISWFFRGIRQSYSRNCRLQVLAFHPVLHYRGNHRHLCSPDGNQEAFDPVSSHECARDGVRSESYYLLYFQCLDDLAGFVISYRSSSAFDRSVSVFPRDRTIH